MLTVVHDGQETNDETGGRSLLDEIVRDGARQVLATALQAEVAAYVAQDADQLDVKRTERGQRALTRATLLVAEGLGQLRVGAAARTRELDEHPRSLANAAPNANTLIASTCHYTMNSS